MKFNGKDVQKIADGDIKIISALDDFKKLSIDIDALCFQLEMLNYNSNIVNKDIADMVSSTIQMFYDKVESLKSTTKVMKVCKRCGRYFFTSNKLVNYCDRIDDDGNVCYVGASQELFSKKLKSDEALRLYNRVYKRIYARMMHCSISISEFEILSKQAKEKLNMVRDNKITMEEYKQWMDNV